MTAGEYALAMKEFTPVMVKAVYDNLDSETPKKKYIIGCDDDVTFTSLPYGAPVDVTPEGNKSCVFWGLGSDGTIGASKTIIDTIAMNTELYA